jgi:ABC-type multidrug transport system fused ATPase/permease subunit
MTYAPSQPQPTITENSAPLAEAEELRVMLPWRARLAEIFRRYCTGTRGLLISGGALSVIYLLLMAAFPIWDWWYRIDDNLATIPHRAPWARPLLMLFSAKHINISLSFLTIMVIVALFALQALALFAAHTAQDVRRARRMVMGFAAAFIAIMIFMQPITSSDLYGYLARSYLMAALHQNPAISLSTLLPGGYLVPHARPPAPYGPLWLVLCWVIGVIAGENLLLAMLLMKALMAAAAFGAILVVGYLADRLLPGQRVVALVFFAWSPLLIFEAIGNGHNDITMMCAVLGSLALIHARRPVLAFPVLALGVLIKYSVGVLVPLWAVFLFFTCCWRADLPALPRLAWPVAAELRQAIAERIRWRRVLAIFGGGGAISVAIAVMCFAPFWVGLKTFTGLGQQLGATYFNASIASVLYAMLQFSTMSAARSSSLASAIRLMLYLIFAAYLAYQTWRLARRGSSATIMHLALASGSVIFAVLLLITFWYQPWYIVWLIPLAALAPDGILRRHAATLAFGGMLTYVAQYFMFVNQPTEMRDILVQVCLVIAAFAPLLVLQHAGFGGTLRAQMNRSFQGLSAFVARRPMFVNRLMLGLILVIAALLRLIRLGGQAPSTSALHVIGGNLSVAVSDARGLDVIFGLLQFASVHLFGNTPFAFLLPTALIGTATVWLIAELAGELFSELPPFRREIVVLLAALLAATAPWHMALSRAGAEVTLLPLLIAGATLALLRARHGSHAPQLCALAGVCIGLMGDLVVGLWPLVALCIAVAGVLWWRRRERHEQGYVLLAAGAVVAGLPALWYPLARFIGFPPDFPILRYQPLHHPLISGDFFARLPHNLWSVAQVVMTQNFAAAGPAAGGIPIVPGVLAPFIVVGILVALRTWRAPSSAILALLVALPFGVALIVAVPASVIVAATVMPGACLLPALGMETVGHWLATLPVLVTGPINRVFVSRQNLLRVAILVVVCMATISTFFWYFASTIIGPTQIVHPV